MQDIAFCVIWFAVSNVFRCNSVAANNLRRLAMNHRAPTNVSVCFAGLRKLNYIHSILRTKM